MRNNLPLRAHTERQKRQCIEALYQCWIHNPSLRLCQLIVALANTHDPFYVEDLTLEQRALDVVAEGWDG